MKSLIKKIILNLYCYRFLSFKLTERILKKLKED